MHSDVFEISQHDLQDCFFDMSPEGSDLIEVAQSDDCTPKPAKEKQRMLPDQSQLMDRAPVRQQGEDLLSSML